MTPTWLSQLAPDRAPPPLDWWHLAPGWWAMALLLLLASGIGVGWLRRWRRPAARWQRAAWRELAQLQSVGADHRCDDATIARGLQHLLRRYAVVRYGRAAVAPLSGEAWLAFVVEHGGTDWAGETGRHLLRCAYGGDASLPHGAEQPPYRAQWIAGAKAFLKATG